MGGFLPSWIQGYSTTPVAPSSTYKISTRVALMIWEWGHDTCDNVNVTMSPSLSAADVISPPLFPVISSTIRGYILQASWRMVCAVCVPIKINQVCLLIWLLSWAPEPALARVTKTTQHPAHISSGSLHSAQSLQPTIGILASHHTNHFLGERSAKKVFENHMPSSIVNHDFLVKIT